MCMDINTIDICHAWPTSRRKHQIQVRGPSGKNLIGNERFELVMEREESELETNIS